MGMTTNIIIISGGTQQTIVGQNANRKFLTIENIGSKTFFLAGSGNVTSGTGYPIYAGATYADAIYIGSYFGVCGSNENATVSYLEED